MKILVIFLLLLIIISCSSTKETTSSSDESPSFNSYTKSASLSPLMKKLIDEIDKEKRNLNKNQKYIPSQNLINYFRLVSAQNNYYVKALLKINDEMDATVLEAVGVKIGTKAGKVWTVYIPVDMLEDVANFSGIDYLQIDEKIKLK